MLSPVLATANEPQTAADELITPNSYEQYLPLSDPKDIAVCDDFTAIADKNNIFLYDRLKAKYRTYTHTENQSTDRNYITQLQFSNDGDLYFLDASSLLHYIPADNLAVDTDLQSQTIANFTCSTFLIANDELFFTNVTGATQIARSSLNDLQYNQAQPFVTGNLTSNVALDYHNGYLYYSNSMILLKISTTAEEASSENVAYFDKYINSFSIANDEIAITTVGNNDNLGDFYSYKLSDLDLMEIANNCTPRAKDERGDYGALTSYENQIYAVCGAAGAKKIRQYAVDEGFTDFEISSASDSEHRLNGATDTHLQRELLYTADTNNSRVSVYDTQTGAYKAYATPAAPTMIAANDETFFAANPTAAWLYNKEGELLQTVTAFNQTGKLVGVTAVFDTYYLVTDQNYFYTLKQSTENETQEWQISGVQKTNSKTPRLLTSDLYGNLYLAEGNNIRRFNEYTFSLADDYGEEICSSVSGAAQKLLVDYDENLYALEGNTVNRYTPNATKSAYSADGQYDLGKSLVYTQTLDTPVTALAISVKENAAYIVYGGNLAVKTPDLNLPNAQNIALTQEVNENIFHSTNGEFAVVQTKANALLVEFDLAQTKDASIFSYTDYDREPQVKTALKIGETETYAVLAIFNTQTHEYQNFLTLKRYVYEDPDQSYLVNYGESKTGYLTNAVTLYKFPYLTELLTVDGLQKNQPVTLLGEVNELDYDYYKVSYTSEDGTQKIGFIPKGYLTDFNGAPKPTQTETFGELSPNEDALWRLTFLLLGTAAVCLLSDLLIFRAISKKKDDEE